MIDIDPLDYPFVTDGHIYATQVVSGEIPACKFVIGACKRYFKDFNNPTFRFDLNKAERYLRLTQKFKHVKGKNWKTENITYEPWQCFAFMNIAGWVDIRTGERRFRVAHLEFPRGNGKSLLASQAVLYFLALDNPKGNEISCAATKTDQARIVLDSSRAMAKACPKYLESTGVEVLAHKIIHDRSNSFVRALSSDDKSLDGLNDILCVIDELHAVSTELFEVISSGLSKRNDSLLLTITTAGRSVESIGYSQSSYAKKVAMGEHLDEQFFSLVYTVDETDNIHSERTWRKANPNYGVSVDPITFHAKSEKAKITPSDLPNFKTKHLNIWVSEANAYFDLAKWDKCANEELTWESVSGLRCFAAVDLSSKVDLTSMGFLFRIPYKTALGADKFKYKFLEKSFIPEVRIEESNNVLLANCLGSGHLIATKGEAISYDTIEKEFITSVKPLKLNSVFYDPWNATQFGQILVAKKFDAQEFRMTTANFSEPMKTLDALIREGEFEHNGSPLLRWCVGNVVAKEDANGNVFPRKTHEKLKIDPVITLLMCLAGWVKEEDNKSVYSSRGIRTI